MSQPVQCLSTLMMGKKNISFSIWNVIFCYLCPSHLFLSLCSFEESPSATATCRPCAPSACSSGGSSWVLIAAWSCPCCHGESQSGPSPPSGLRQELGREEKWFSPLCWSVGNHLCCKGAPLTGVELAVHWAAQVFCKAAALAMSDIIPGAGPGVCTWWDLCWPIFILSTCQGFPA